uniref:Uncharacterized protein n=1 Tax=Alexandrium monilatum TaxID=311494 RepID=A0A7S4TAB3_9DINO|mmetsp:Transcript_30889/g.91786  ORF Transcript_30889/g.91786 Transcript_30889/m.91786 type:complete len:371 (-) Transcript_30889:300-1412(-)
MPWAPGSVVRELSSLRRCNEHQLDDHDLDHDHVIDDDKHHDDVLHQHHRLHSDADHNDGHYGHNDSLLHGLVWLLQFQRPMLTPEGSRVWRMPRLRSPDADAHSPADAAARACRTNRTFRTEVLPFVVLRLFGGRDVQHRAVEALRKLQRMRGQNHDNDEYILDHHNNDHKYEVYDDVNVNYLDSDNHQLHNNVHQHHDVQHNDHLHDHHLDDLPHDEHDDHNRHFDDHHHLNRDGHRQHDDPHHQDPDHDDQNLIHVDPHHHDHQHHDQLHDDFVDVDLVDVDVVHDVLQHNDLFDLDLLDDYGYRVDDHDVDHHGNGDEDIVDHLHHDDRGLPRLVPVLLGGHPVRRKFRPVVFSVCRVCWWKLRWRS